MFYIDFKENVLKYLLKWQDIISIFTLVASFYQVKDMCDIMVYNNKYIFSLHLVPGTELLRLLEFPVMRAIKMSFKGNINQETFGRHISVGPGFQESQTWD